MRPVAAEGFGHLQRQLASGQHQGLGLLAVGVDAGQDRDGEGGGLAGAGLGQSDDVRPGQQRRDGGGLDRRRRLVADVGHSLQHGWVNLQFGEGICRWLGARHFAASLVPVRVAPSRPGLAAVPCSDCVERLSTAALGCAAAAALVSCSPGGSTVSKPRFRRPRGDRPRDPHRGRRPPPPETPLRRTLRREPRRAGVSQPSRSYPRSTQPPGWNPEPVAGNYNNAPRCRQSSSRPTPTRPTPTPRGDVPSESSFPPVCRTPTGSTESTPLRAPGTPSH